VKLLFDENLSPRLIDLLGEEFPGSSHVLVAGLGGASDARIWDYAQDQEFTIVSKDDDFRQRSFLDGAPPKVVWLQVGNAGTTIVVNLLLNEAAKLRAFESEDESSLLIVRGAV
jgi:predicted nuclease of predicted toxin-antitoxin system